MVATGASAGHSLGAFLRLAVIGECSHPGEFKGACVGCGTDMESVRKFDLELPSTSSLILTKDVAPILAAISEWVHPAGIAATPTASTDRVYVDEAETAVQAW